LGLSFFGLTSNTASIARANLFTQIHEIVFHGKGGYDWNTIYNMPRWLRLFTFNKINEFYQKENFIVIIKSTIPPGTTEQLNKEFKYLHIAFNPEFLTEANAVEDYKNQNRIIIGADRPYSSRVKQIFSKSFPKVPIIKTSSTIAETIKYVTNTFLSMKVSYANEIYQLCNTLEIDYDKVIEYARYDDRLGNSHWSVPGPDGDLGFGGHCFPKDIAALQYVMKTLNVDSTMLDSTIIKNEMVRTDKDWEKQIGRAVSKN